MGLSGIFIRDSLTSGIALAEVEFRPALEHKVLEVAIDALDYAKENAPWEDRSGDAREGLDADVDWKGDVIVWQMFHTVPYGIYLETRWSGRFAIIMPTLEEYAPRVGRGLDLGGSGG